MKSNDNSKTENNIATSSSATTGTSSVAGQANVRLPLRAEERGKRSSSNLASRKPLFRRDLVQCERDHEFQKHFDWTNA